MQTVHMFEAGHSFGRVFFCMLKVQFTQAVSCGLIIGSSKHADTQL